MSHANLEKMILSSPDKSQIYDLLIISLGALPLNYRRLAGAWAITLQGPREKLPAYCQGTKADKVGEIIMMIIIIYYCDKSKMVELQHGR